MVYVLEVGSRNLLLVQKIRYYADVFSFGDLDSHEPQRHHVVGVLIVEERAVVAFRYHPVKAWVVLDELCLPGCQDHCPHDVELVFLGKIEALERLLHAHSGFSRSDLQGYLNLFAFTMNPPSEHVLKVDELLNLAFDTHEMLRYREFYKVKSKKGDCETL